MKKSKILLFHILLWALFFIPINIAPVLMFILNKKIILEKFPTIDYDIHLMLESVSIVLVRFFILFYISYFIIYKLLFQNRNWKNITITIGIFLFLCIHRWLWGFMPVLNPDNLSFTEKISSITLFKSVAIVVITIFQCTIAFGIRSLFEFIKEKRRRKELEASDLKSKLNLLRSQVNPHFIFNTLNNIDALIHKHPDKASDLLIKLSDEIRYMLYDANVDKIDIASEITFLNNYISLQEIRINHYNPVDIETEIDNKDEKVPPMLFIPLIENAFKHGIFTNKNNIVKININLKSKELHFSIMNSFDPNKNNHTKHNGIGLELVKKRLALIYPEKHYFKIFEEKELFTVKFSINLNEN